MSNINCVVYGCSNTYKNTRSLDPPVSFYSFPTKSHEKEKLEKWIQFVKRNEKNKTPWRPTKHSRICSRHFADFNKSPHPLSPSYNPSIHPVSPTPEVTINMKRKRHERLLARKQRKLDLPQPPPPPPEPPGEDLEQEPKFKDCGCQTDETESDFGNMTSFISVITDVPNSNSSRDAMTYVEHKEVKSSSTNTEVKEHRDKSVGSSTQEFGFYGMESVESDEDALKDLTSPSLTMFSILLNLVPDYVPRPNEMSKKNKLLRFLMKLKLGLTFSALGVLFGIHRTTSQRVFTNVLVVLYGRTKSWIFWPTRESVRATMYDGFKEKYSNCRAILDCTEIRTERPPTVEQRILMWSVYKSAFTIKFLIGMSPGGLISFISSGYGGRSSDGAITNDCGIIDLVEPGDSIMVDKGFPSIKTSLEEKNVLTVMPPFAEANQLQFSEEQMDETYSIASVRIHVERIIQRLKIYRILSNRVPIDMLKFMDQVMHICAVLVNLQPPIVKKKD